MLKPAREKPDREMNNKKVILQQARGVTML
jgi:hypothetical protein